MKRILSCVVLILFSFTVQAETVKLLIKNAVIFTMEPNQQKPFRGYVTVGDNGLITQIGEGEPVGIMAKQIEDAKGGWLIPGFISAHSHLWQAAFKGVAEDKTLQKWIDDVYGRAAQLKPADFYYFALLGSLDHLRHGITTVYSFNFNNLRQATNLTNEYDKAQFKGMSAAGIRFVHGYSPEMMKPDSQFSGGVTRLNDFLVWAKAQPTDRYLGTMISGATSFNNTYKQSQFEALLMKQFQLRNQTHYLEEAAMQRDEIAKYKWLKQSGILSNVFFGHFVHPDQAILKDVARLHIGMSWNPLSNGRLASGVADIPKYVKLGIPIGMGVDGEASSDRADPFENMRTGLYAVRAKYLNASALSPYQVLWFHTQGGAKLLGIDNKVGSIKVGKAGDFVLINPLELGAPIEDLYANLVFSAGENDIEAVYVAGERLVSQHKFLQHDIQNLHRNVNVLSGSTT